MRFVSSRLALDGRLAACAGDVAAACRSMRGVVVVSGASAVQSATGLHLNASKAVVVPVGPLKLGGAAREMVSSWLRVHAPPLAAARV